MLTDGSFDLTKNESTSSYMYLNIPKTQFPISDFIGKKLTVKTDVLSLTASQLRLSLFYMDGGTWSTAITKSISTTGLFEGEIDLPSTVEQVRIRFDIMGNSGDKVIFNKFRLILS